MSTSSITSAYTFDIIVAEFKNIPKTELPYIWNGFFFWSLTMRKKLKDFMITPTCYSSRFCARSTYSFSRDDSPANVFEDNRMIWLTSRFLKSKKYHHFSFSRIRRMKFLPWERATAKQFYRFRICFHVFFFFGLVVRRGIPDKWCLNSLSNFIT